MRPGRVVQFRLNPKDCMAVIDVIQKANAHIPGMSFAQAVAMAFSCMSETFRRYKLIPTRDGFEYSEMMLDFPSTSRGMKARQFSIQQTIESLGSEIYHPSLSVPQEKNESYSDAPDLANHHSIEVRTLYRQLLEADAKKQIDPINFDETSYNELIEQLSNLTNPQNGLATI